MLNLARLAPALFVVLWATGFIGARYAMPWAEPFAFLAVRFVLSAALVWALCLRFRAPAMKAAGIGHSIIAGILMHGVYLGSVFWAINAGMPAGLSALIIGLQPLVTAFMAGPTLAERIEPRHWAGLVIGFVGVVIVLSPRLGVLGSGINTATLGASLLSVLGMSAGTIWQKKFVRNGDLLRGTFWQYVGAATVTGLLALLFETGEFTLTGELIFAMVWLVFVLSLGAILLLMYLIAQGAISRVASLFYLVPACTAVFAWLLFGEELSAIQIAGMAVSGFGVALATAKRRERSPAASGSA